MRINNKLSAIMTILTIASFAGGQQAMSQPTDPTTPTSSGPQWQKPFPLGFSLEYTLVSDFVWRGMNLSEYPGEGREKPNHQLCATMELDTTDILGEGTYFGTLGGSVWFQWYAAQQRLTPWADTNLQEVDFGVSWTYEIDTINTSVELGWLAYHFPPYRRSGSPESDVSSTCEVYAKVSFDDSLIFGRSLFNPYIAYYHDMDLVKAGWFELGVSHDFELSQLGMDDMPVLKDITITPSVVLGISHRFYDKGDVGSANSVATRLGNLEYGLDITYDLSGALGMPQKYGTLSIGGFINFSQAFHNTSPDINDVLYGGMTLGYSW